MWARWKRWVVCESWTRECTCSVKQGGASGASRSFARVSYPWLRFWVIASCRAARIAEAP